MVKAVDIYTDMGRFTVAAKHHQTIAEIYETDVADLEKAMHHYEQARRTNAEICNFYQDKKNLESTDCVYIFFPQAADFFKGEESNSSANKCMLKVAQYAAQLENYDRAIKIYEDVRKQVVKINPPTIENI